ncbi:methyltransferase-domain-containing protein [Dipodascopsis uninucleata]
MNLFEVEGWSIPSKVTVPNGGFISQDSATTVVEDLSKNSVKNRQSSKDKKKKRRKLSINKSANIIAAEQLLNKNEEVKSDDLQKLFNMQFQKKSESSNQKQSESKFKESTILEVASKKHESPKDLKSTIARADLNKTSQSKKQKSERSIKEKKTALEIDSITNIPSLAPKGSEMKLTPLQRKMKEKLTGSRFRWINEKLYTISSEEAEKLIKEHPDLFNEYHEGFRNQVQSWPENPVKFYVEKIQELSKKRGPISVGLPRDNKGTTIIADMGCGDAELALNVATAFTKLNSKKDRKPSKMHNNIVVHSFDLSKTNERVTVADIKHVPLADESTHIVIFCLSLMGTNFLDFIKEAHRILRPRGLLWISEIKSRFSDRDGADFVQAIRKLGFLHTETDASNLMFIRFSFFKPVSERKLKNEIAETEKLNEKKRKMKFIEEDEPYSSDADESKHTLPLLKPCIYKKR